MLRKGIPHRGQHLSGDQVVGALPYCGVDCAEAANDNEMGQADFDQLAETFGAVVRGADDAEPAEKIC